MRRFCCDIIIIDAHKELEAFVSGLQINWNPKGDFEVTY